MGEGILAGETQRERAYEADMVRQVLDLLAKSGFGLESPWSVEYNVFDVLARREYLGKTRHYGIVVKKYFGEKHLKYVMAGPNILQQSRDNDVIDEVWVVADKAAKSAQKMQRLPLKNIRFMTFSELRSAVREFAPRTGQSLRVAAKTRIGKAVLANSNEISVTISSVLALVDEKIKTLRDERPNSEDAIAKRDASVNEYVRLRDEVTRLAATVEAYTQRKAPEKEVVKSFKTFGDGVQSWWNKGHEPQPYQLVSNKSPPMIPKERSE
jgi:hypothetical protein